MLRLPHGMPSVGTVVVADDDAGFRQVLKSMLAGIADRLIEAEDGAQALAAVAGGRVDLVLADLIMPGVDGDALLERLPAGLPAIVITGLDVPAAAARRGAAAQGGADQGTAGVRHPAVPSGRHDDRARRHALLLVDDDEAKRYLLGDLAAAGGSHA